MSSRSRFHRIVIGPLAVGAAVIGAAAFTAAPPAQAATASVTVTLNGSLLTITGDPVANSLTVGRTAAGAITLNGTVVLGGTATTANVLDIVMDGGAGNDTLRLDETNGAMPRIEFHGGDGNDQLFGGSKADSLLGGPGGDTLVGNSGDDNLVGDAGNDKAIGGPGDDTVSLGADSDQFTWNPGDGNDLHVDGDTGTDTLLFNGSDAGETVNVGPVPGDASRARVERFTSSDPTRRGVNFSGFELLKTIMAGGTDLVNVADHDLPGLNVLRVGLGTGQGDHAFVQAFGNGPAGSSGVRVGGSPAAGVTVSDLPATVLITGDTMIVQVAGNSGNDVIDASRLAAGTVTQLIENGNEGNDKLIGSPGHDQLFGGPGTDRFEERGGNDLTDAEPGEVVIP